MQRVASRLALVAALALLFAGSRSPAAEPAPAPSELESHYLANLHQLTSGFQRAGEGYFSPDGREIVYQAVPQDYVFYQIYRQQLDGSAAPRLVSTGRGRTTCAFFTRDGQELIFASSHLDPMLDQTEAAEREKIEEDRRLGRRRRYDWPFDPFSDIFRTDSATGQLAPLTSEYGYDAEGSFSPDGSQIVFCSTRDGDPDLYLMNADGTNVRQLTNAPGYDGGPFFSPDGQWVIFRSDRKEKDMLQIYVIGVDGRHELALTDNIGVNWAPYWHPSEPYLIWTGADHSDPNARPNYDLWLLRYEVVDGQLRGVGAPLRVTDDPGADVLPVFSPDGTKLMWTASRTADRSSQLWWADFTLPSGE